MAKDVEILCPKCEWKPDGQAYWACSCGHSWNTFETGGRCPKCKKVWKDTQCPGPSGPGGCGEWSPHIDWYKNLDEQLRKQLEEILQTADIES